MATTTGEELPARERIVEAAGRLLCTRGYAAASLRDIVEEARAPWGSLQHYFPGGKHELAIEAIDAGRVRVGAFIDTAFARTRGADGALRWFFEQSTELLTQSSYVTGCPIGTVALERAALDDDISHACAAALEDWTTRFEAGLRADGLEPRAARRLAGTIIAQYEGALMIARVQRSTEPVRAAGTVVRQLLAAAR
jgi:TetR/AcrR family transcriptional regulator, lmrAB and yxaGH operons repressor